MLFKELSKEVQIKVLNNFRCNDPDNHDYAYQNVIDNATHYFKSIGIHGAQFVWSGFGSQGDGVRLDECEYIDLERLCKLCNIECEDFFKDITLSIYKNRSANRYTSHTTFSLEFDEGMTSELTADQYTILGAHEYLLTAKVREQCMNVYKELYDEYMFINSDEYVTSTIEGNEYEFNPCGCII